MILIPLVENCFKHCDFDSNPDAFAQIRLGIREEQLQFETFNSKDDTQQKDKTGGVGLQNIRKRLQLKYKDAYKLSILPGVDQFRVQLSLPLSTKKPSHHG
jgi:LytS/YehU family sensor histidine kinase